MASWGNGVVGYGRTAFVSAAARLGAGAIAGAGAMESSGVAVVALSPNPLPQQIDGLDAAFILPSGGQDGPIGVRVSVFLTNNVESTTSVAGAGWGLYAVGAGPAFGPLNFPAMVNQLADLFSDLATGSYTASSLAKICKHFSSRPGGGLVIPSNSGAIVVAAAVGPNQVITGGTISTGDLSLTVYGGLLAPGQDVQASAAPDRVVTPDASGHYPTTGQLRTPARFGNVAAPGSREL